VASTLHGLAKLYLDQQKYEQAEPLLQRALTIRERSLSPEHPDVAATLEIYRDLLHKTNRESQASALEVHMGTVRAKQ
jgi:hypothetical protein